MKKNLCFCAALFVACFSAVYSLAQINLNQPLPVDPSVKIGKLANGLTYYIRKNVKPEKKVELRLAVNAGIDANLLPQALAGGFADSIPLQLFVPRMVQNIHSPPSGYISTMLKDLDTVVEVARNTSSPVPMSALAAQLFRLAKAARGADADALEVYKLSEAKADR